MAEVLVPIATGCEELEAVTIVDLLRRAGITVVTAALEAGPITAAHGIVITPDATLAEVEDQDFAMIVLPGGLPGTDHLAADRRLLAMLERHAAAGAYTAAICAAPRVLAAIGLLDGKQAAHYPGALVAADYPQVALSDAPVVVDGKVVTSRGPGTAMDFALRLIELLRDRATRDQVEQALVRNA